MKTLFILALVFMIGCTDDPVTPGTPGKPAQSIAGDWHGLSDDGHETIQVKITQSGESLTVKVTGGSVAPGMTVSGTIKSGKVLFGHDPMSNGDPTTGIVLSYAGDYTSVNRIDGWLLLNRNWGEAYFSQAMPLIRQ